VGPPTPHVSVAATSPTGARQGLGYMATPKLHGPHRLISGLVRIFVPPGVAGVYALGPLGPGGLQNVDAVGRADRDLAEVLRGLVGVDSGFMFATASSVAEAFKMECELYHENLLADRRPHPVAPKDTALKCPICGGG